MVPRKALFLLILTDFVRRLSVRNMLCRLSWIRTEKHSEFCMQKLRLLVLGRDEFPIPKEKSNRRFPFPKTEIRTAIRRRGAARPAPRRRRGFRWSRPASARSASIRRSAGRPFAAKNGNVKCKSRRCKNTPFWGVKPASCYSEPVGVNWPLRNDLVFLVYLLSSHHHVSDTDPLWPVLSGPLSDRRVIVVHVISRSSEHAFYTDGTQTREGWKCRPVAEPARAES